MRSPDILIRCDGGLTQGLGHVTRCLSLARTIVEVNPAASVQFWGSYDEFAGSLLAQFGFVVLESASVGYSAADGERAVEVCRKFDYVVLDSYDVEQGFLDALTTEAFRTVVIDDLQLLNLSAVDMVVCFRAGAEEFSYGAHCEALGLGYLIVKPEIRELRIDGIKKALRIPRRLLIFLSGSSLGASYVPALVNCLRMPGIEVTFVGRRKDCLQSVPDVKFVALRQDIEIVMSQSDFLVCGGGLVKYESAYLGVPNACLSQTGVQLEDTRRATELGITSDLGAIDDFNVRNVREQVSDILSNQALLRAQREASRRIFNTDSTRDLARLLLSV